MSKFFTILLSVVLAFCLLVPGFASAPADGVEAGEGENTSETPIENTAISEPTEGVLLSSSVYSLNPVTSADTTGLKAVLLNLLGEYDAVVVEYAYENTNGYVSYVREIQPDYVWLCSAAIFLVLIFCVFRAGGALLSKT